MTGATPAPPTPAGPGPAGDWGTVAALLDALRTGRTTPTAIVDAVCDRWRGRDDDHAWIHRATRDELRARAAELEAVPGGSRLPLYGVPVGVKDNIDVAGMPTTAACPAYAYEPARSAPAVQALLDAGAVVVGKTNLDQFATGLTGARSPYGTPVHPVDARWIPGGSSSGSAVAVASGTVPVALATDTAGSGRVPAALCGIVGLKPGTGWCSTEGVVPACASFDCVSVLATSVADAALAVDVIRGSVAPAAVTADTRFGIPDGTSLDFLGDVDAASGFTGTAARLADLGPLVDVDLADFLAAGSLLYDGPLLAERYAAVGAFIEAHPDDVLPVTASVVRGGARYTPADVAGAHQRLAELRDATAPVWRRIDALVVPTVPTSFTVDEVAADPVGRNALLGRYCHFVNLLGLMAVAVPTGTTPDGHPLGVTVVGPPGNEAHLLWTARQLEAGVRPPA